MFGIGRSSTVARADVEFHAETGQAELDIKQFSRIVDQSMDSTERNLRAGALAWERYERSMANVAPDSYQARRALVTLERELERVRRETERTRHEQDRLRHTAQRSSTEISKVARGSIAASGAFKGLGNALFFASGAFAGAFGLVYALRSTFEAAARAQVSVTRLSRAVHNAGLSWQENRKQILDTIEAQSKLTAFDDEELKDSLAGFVIRTKDVNEALKLNQLAADIARARNISLDASMRLVTRASLGQTSSLRRLGIDVEKVTTEQDKLRESGVKVTFAQRQAAKASDEAATKAYVVAQLQAKFGGQAARYAQTAAGRQEYFNKVLEDTKEIIGAALLPTFVRLLTKFTDWLDKLNESGDLQKNINEDLRQAGYIFHAVEDAINDARAVLGPFVDLMGGTHDAVKKVLELYTIYKIGKIATSIKAMAEMWGLVGPAATKAAAETVIAEQAIGGGAIVATGKVAGLRRALAFLLGPAGITAAATIGGDLASRADTQGRRDVSKYPRLMAVVRKRLAGQILTPDEAAALARATAGGYVISANGRTNAPDSQLAAAEKMLKQGAVTYEETHTTPPPTAKTRPTPKGTRPARTEVDIQLDIASAQAHGNETAEIKYHKELIALYQRRADRLEALKKQGKLTLLQKQQLTQLYNEIDSEQSAIDSIISGRQSEARSRAAAAAAAARKRHQAHKDKVDARLAYLENQALRAAQSAGVKDDQIWNQKLLAAYRAAAHDQELTAKERESYEKKRLTALAKIKAAREKGYEARLDVKEQKLRNAVDAAALKDGIKDDEAALKRLIAFYRKKAHNMDVAVKERQEATRKMIAAQKKLKKLREDEKKDGVQSGAEFLTSLQGVLNTYGGNLFGMGELQVKGRAGDKAATAHTIIQTSLLRDQNRILTDLSNQVRTPASSAGYTNMTSLYDGYATA